MTTEASTNGDTGPALDAAPQAAEKDTSHAHNNGAAPMNGAAPTSSFGAVLEAANDIRRLGEVHDIAETPVSAPAPTLEDLADALDEEDPVFTAVADADAYEDCEGDGADSEEEERRAAYSAKTAAAISALMNGEESALLKKDGEEGLDGGHKAARKEITLQDRTAAMLSVYKDYVQEVEEKLGEQDASGDMRREEIKVAALENFCKEVGTDDYVSDGGEEDEDEDEYSGTEKYRAARPAAKPKMRPATAATTTAAFRLKAEVALKVVKTKVNDAVSRGSDIQKDAGDFENDYDFQVSDDGMGVQNEEREDLEYGIPHERMDTGAGSDAGSAVYGMHILDRDKSMRRKSNDNEDSIGAFDDLCDELGVTPDTHEGLEHHVYQRRSGRYRYPIFRSKKFRQSMMYCSALLLFLLVAASVMSAITNGFEEVRHKRAPPLPDWKSEEDWREKQKVDWEKSHPSEHPAKDNGNGLKVGIDGQKSLGKLFQKISAAYRPVWYDRSTGWTGQTYAEAVTWCDAHNNYIPCPYEVYCPSENTLLAGVMDEDGESWAAVVNDRNEWVQVGSKGGVCDLYSSRYGRHPDWGTTGQDNEALTRHVMCCRSHPITVDEDALGENDGKHVFKAKGPPKGAPKPPIAPSEGFEQIPPPLKEEATSSGQDIPFATTQEAMDATQLYISVSKAYNPVWYDRESGWMGRTYQDSLDFCANLEGIPCPYEVYCPGGMGKLLDGVRDKGESWSAVIDGDGNDWVQVGAGGVCNLYSETAKELPSWGISGENNEAITRHIMCCDGSGHADANEEVGAEEAMNYNADMTGPGLVVLPEPASQVETTTDNDAANEPSSNEDALDTAVTASDEGANDEPGSSMTAWEIQVEETHHPAWLNNLYGWNGGSYDDARSFCESIPHGDGTLHLCPASAYCPNGPREKEPLYLQMDAFEGVQWAPVSNEENGWIQVGNIAGLTCQTYMQINHREPTWGLDGSSAQLKQNILCCEDDTETHAAPAEDHSQTATTADTPVVEPAQSSVNDNSSEGESSTAEGGSFKDSISSTFNPMWFNLDQGGWQGGSHSDAQAFCEQFAGLHGKRMELCPYAAYCPEGPGMPAMDGHVADFSKEPDQFAPVFGGNHWVKISDTGNDSATICKSHVQLTGMEPSWGLDGSNKELKQHVMCCSPFQ